MQPHQSPFSLNSGASSSLRSLGSRSGPLSAMYPLNELQNGSRIPVPSILLRGTCSIFADTTPEIRLHSKAPKQIRKGNAIVRVRDNKAVHAFGNDLRTAVIDAGDHRESTGHRFERGQRESIFAAGAYVNIRGSIKIHDVRLRMFPHTTFVDT